MVAEMRFTPPRRARRLQESVSTRREEPIYDDVCDEIDIPDVGLRCKQITISKMSSGRGPLLEFTDAHDVVAKNFAVETQPSQHNALTAPRVLLLEMIILTGSWQSGGRTPFRHRPCHGPCRQSQDLREQAGWACLATSLN